MLALGVLALAVVFGVIVGVLLSSMAVGIPAILFEKSDDVFFKRITLSLWLLSAAATLNVVGEVFLV